MMQSLLSSEEAMNSMHNTSIGIGCHVVREQGWVDDILMVSAMQNVARKKNPADF
jgi:hypothetical protein